MRMFFTLSLEYEDDEYDPEDDDPERRELDPERREPERPARLADKVDDCE